IPPSPPVSPLRPHCGLSNWPRFFPGIEPTCLSAARGMQKGRTLARPFKSLAAEQSLPLVGAVPVLQRVAVVIALLRRRLCELRQGGGGDRHRKDGGSNERLHGFLLRYPIDPLMRGKVWARRRMCNAQCLEASVSG